MQDITNFGNKKRNLGSFLLMPVAAAVLAPWDAWKIARWNLKLSRISFYEYVAAANDLNPLLLLVELQISTFY